MRRYNISDILFWFGIIVACGLLLYWSFSTHYVLGFLTLGMLTTLLGLALKD